MSTPTITITAVVQDVPLELRNQSPLQDLLAVVEDDSDGTWDDGDWDSGDTSYDGASGQAVASGGGTLDAQVSDAATYVRMFLYDSEAAKGDAYLYAALWAPGTAGDWTSSPTLADHDGAAVTVGSGAASGSDAAWTSVSFPVSAALVNETGGTDLAVTLEADSDGRFADESDWSTSNLGYDKDYAEPSDEGTNALSILTDADSYYRMLVYDSSSPGSGDDAVAGALISADWTQLVDAFGTDDYFDFDLSGGGTVMLEAAPGKKKPSGWPAWLAWTLAILGALAAVGLAIYLLRRYAIPRA